jgi:trans-aconitate methyltransferase
MAVDEATYWRKRGPVYERDFRPERYREQEQVLAEVIDGLTFHTVLDVGCGFGRIGEIVMRLRPRATYRGIDVSPEQLAAARRRIPSGIFTLGDARTLDPGRRYDLVIASEILMHIPPSEVGNVVARLVAVSRRLVTVDWQAPGSEAGGYCWGHDYRTLFGPDAVSHPVGQQAVWLR